MHIEWMNRKNFLVKLILSSRWVRSIVTSPSRLFLYYYTFYYLECFAGSLNWPRWYVRTGAFLLINFACNNVHIKSVRIFCRYIARYVFFSITWKYIIVRFFHVKINRSHRLLAVKEIQLACILDVIIPVTDQARLDPWEWSGFSKVIIFCFFSKLSDVVYKERNGKLFFKFQK